MDQTSKLNRYRVTARQVERLAQRIGALGHRSQYWSWARVVVFIISVILLLVTLFSIGAMAFWGTLLVVILVFGVVVAIHRRLDDSLERHRQWSALKVEQLARMRIDWNQLPPSRVQPNFKHPFEGDLDLVGANSVAALIDLSFTAQGGDRLRSWLTDPTPPLAEIIRRQELVGELLPKHLLRMQLLVSAKSLSDANADGEQAIWESDELERWVGNYSTTPRWRMWLLLCWILAGLNILFVLWDQLLGGPVLWTYSWILYGLIVFGFSAIGSTDGGQRDVFDDAIRLRKPFEQLVALFGRLERFSYRNMPAFRMLCEPYLDPEHQPSQYLKRLVRIINATGMRGNPLIWLVLNLLAPWDMHFAYELDRCKRDIHAHLPTWLDRWAEIEALNSLANMGYLNPNYRFPSVEGVESSASMDSSPSPGTPTNVSPFFKAEQLAHPLLPDIGIQQEIGLDTSMDPEGRQGAIEKRTKVANDFEFERLGEVRLLTGSNMSGKSTFLRTIGVNMALAYAGAPVDAQLLILHRFRLFSSIKVTDSVTDGISYFYAEVKRLRALLNALEDDDELPVFFFIDEIYRGTNNRERLIGSRAYIKAVTGMNGVGMISTHDLDLALLADDVPDIRNYHFRDEVRDGKMYFDYKVRPGPCPTTNALKIMAMEGLPAGEENG